jgi:hypothetical protein
VTGGRRETAHAPIVLPATRNFGYGSTSVVPTRFLRSRILSVVPPIPAMPSVDCRSGASCQEETLAETLFHAEQVQRPAYLTNVV